jgi:quercetin dioxygenase-like cupin family protein
MSKQGLIEKNWGYEVVWASTEKYCAKMLVFSKAGNRTSLHFHKIKDKTWFVNTGKFILRWIDTDTAENKESVLSEGMTWHCQPLRPHQLEAITDGSMISEVSTADLAADTFLITPSYKVED